MRIAQAKTLGTVERERERESYTLNKQSAVLFEDLAQILLNRKIRYKRKIAINLL